MVVYIQPEGSTRIGEPIMPPEQRPATPQLRRVLGLWDLVFYGIVLIQPIAAVGLFGIAMQMSRGHMVTTILIAMLAMMLTAVSYGRMASLYPSAGSAYTYVSRGLNPYLGFIAGWAMVLDYLIIPIVSTIYAALTLSRIIPWVPYAVWVVLLCTLTTVLNIRGIRTTAKSNIVLLFSMCVVIGAFFIMAVRYISMTHGAAALISVKPFYDPATFNIRAVFTATSFAALTYIGFDGVTTLAEEVKNPRKNVLLATVLVCGITGIFSTIQIYLASLVWPTYSTFPNVETAFLDVCRRAGGEWLFQAMAWTLFVACLGTALTGQVGSARLLFGMGRDGVLPKRFFGVLDKRTNAPLFNICFIGVITVVGSLLFNYEHAAEVLNFGAFMAFMGVNVAVIRAFYFRRESGRRSFSIDLLAPAAGFLFCLVIWCSLPSLAKWIGGAWVLAGSLYLAIRTRGLRRSPISLKSIEES
jgi:putrescine importer